MMLQTKRLIIRENKRDRGETCEKEKENNKKVKKEKEKIIKFDFFFWNRLNVNNEGTCK